MEPCSHLLCPGPRLEGVACAEASMMGIQNLVSSPKHLGQTHRRAWQVSRHVSTGAAGGHHARRRPPEQAESSGGPGTQVTTPSQPRPRGYGCGSPPGDRSPSSSHPLAFCIFLIKRQKAGLRDGPREEHPVLTSRTSAPTTCRRQADWARALGAGTSFGEGTGAAQAQWATQRGCPASTWSPP